MRLDTEKIRRELTRINKTQADMADEWQVTRQYINYLLSGKRNPHFQTVQKLADYFGMDAKDLIK